MTFPVLLYHRIFNKDFHGWKYDVPLSLFREHMLIARNLSFSTTTIRDSVSGGEPNEFMVTFDDGYKSDVEYALPLLEDFGFKGMFFITLEFVGKEGFLTWGDIKYLVMRGMSVQSHGLRHIYLTSLDDDKLETELKRSKEEIQDRVGKHVDYISLPGGAVSTRVLEMTRRCGYKGVFTSKPGIRHKIGENEQFSIFRRFVITRKTSPDEMLNILRKKPWTNIAYELTYAIKEGVRKMIGHDNYYKLWDMFFKMAR